MDLQEILKSIIEVILIPAIGLATTYLVKWLHAKAQELAASSKYYKYQDCIYTLERIVTNCVLTTQQTYVDELKKENAFTKEAQLEAFQKTYQAIIAQLSSDILDVFKEQQIDIDKYITSAIEKTVYENKQK